MRLIGALGGLDDEEVRATFNGGIGMIAVVAPDAFPMALAEFRRRDIEATLIGRVVHAEPDGGARYVEAPLEGLA